MMLYHICRQRLCVSLAKCGYVHMNIHLTSLHGYYSIFVGCFYLCAIDHDGKVK